jgi:hypothetical protein
MESVTESNSTAALSGVSPSPVRSGGTIKRKEPSAAQGCVLPAAGQSTPKKFKVPEDIKEEVRVLIADKLMSIDVDVRLRALSELSGIYTTRDQPHPQKEEYSRAVDGWHGGHFVLVVLRQELAKGDGANRDVVFQAIRFLANWNMAAPRCRDAMSSFKGIGSIAGAMQAYPNDQEIQYATICCFLNCTCDRDAARLQEIVDDDAVVCVVEALITFAEDKRIVTHGVKILDRLHGASHWRRLVKDGALVAVSEAIKAHVDSCDGDRVLTLCYNLVKKLCVP